MKKDYYLLIAVVAVISAAYYFKHRRPANTAYGMKTEMDTVKIIWDGSGPHSEHNVTPRPGYNTTGGVTTGSENVFVGRKAFIDLDTVNVIHFKNK